MTFSWAGRQLCTVNVYEDVISYTYNGNDTLLTCVVVGAVVGAAGIKAGTLASSIKMSKIRLLGRIGEQMSSWTKNSTRITSLTGSAKYRIPDYLNTAQYNYLLGYV